MKAEAERISACWAVEQLVARMVLEIVPWWFESTLPNQITVSDFDLTTRKSVGLT